MGKKEYTKEEHDKLQALAYERGRFDERNEQVSKAAGSLLAEDAAAFAKPSTVALGIGLTLTYPDDVSWVRIDEGGRVLYFEGESLDILLNVLASGRGSNLARIVPVN